MEMQRKHLEKAILLSLLLANVCRVGGAAEYDIQITGNESGYDDIKIVDDSSGAVTYTFAGENKLQGITPIAIKDKTVSIHADDMLTVLGEGDTAVVMAAGKDAQLTFSGGKIKVEKKTNLSLVEVKDGGTIVFDNQSTEILSEKTIYGIHIDGNESKVVFSEQAENLKIESNAGIFMDSGTLEYNNIAGKVRIDTTKSGSGYGVHLQGMANDPTNVKKNITFRGAETAIIAAPEEPLKKSDVSAAVYLNVVNADEVNKLEFLADNTILYGQAGLVIDEYMADLGDADTTIHFAGKTTITGRVDDGTSFPSTGHGSAITSFKQAAKINFDDQVTLVGEALDAGESYGAQIEAGTVLTAKKGMLVSAKANKNKAVGLGVEGANSRIDITGDTVISAESISEKGIGIQGWSKSRVDLNGALNVVAKSSNNSATGLWSWDHSQINVGGDAVISAVSDSGTATGINSNDNSSTGSGADSLTQIKGKATINAFGKGKTRGIYAYQKGDVVINSGADIVAVSSNDVAMGIASTDGSTVKIDGVTNLTVQSKSTTGDATVGINGKVELGAANIFVEAVTSATGIQSWSNNKVTFSDDAQIIIDADGNDAKGIYNRNGSQVDFAGDAAIKIGGIEGSDKNAYYVRAITAESNSIVNVDGDAIFELEGSDTIGLDLNTGTVNVVGDVVTVAKATGSVKGIGATNSNVDIDGDYILQGQSSSGIVKGIAVTGGSVDIAGVANIIIGSGSYGNGIDTKQSTVKLGAANIKVSSESTGGGNSLGIYSFWDTNVTVDGAVVIDVTADNNNALGLAGYWNSSTDIVGSAQITVNSKQGAATGINGYTKMITSIGGDAFVKVSGISAKGIETSKESSVTVAGAAWLDVCGDRNAEVVGVIAGGDEDVPTKHTTVTFKDTAYIKIGHNDTAAEKTRATGESFGVVARNSSTVDFNGDAVIDTSGTASGSDVYGAYAYSGGSIEFKKGLVLDNQGKKYSLYVSGDGSKIDVNSSGSGDVYLKGDIKAINEGILNLDLATENSYFAGAATTENNGKLHMKLRQGALWNLTADSDLSGLVFKDGAVLDMAQTVGYQNLRTDDFTGSGATLVLGTDIGSDRSDKVYITGSKETGAANHNIQIKDAGRNVGENLHLLLVDDASGKYTFTAQDTYGGGIYNYKAELAKETAHSGFQWYLESMKASDVSQDAKALGKVGAGIYSLVVTGNDSLRSRLGELREDADAGVWVRAYGGRLKGDSFTENYQTYQLGYDMPFSSVEGAATDWIGGAAVEYSKGNIGYGIGSGENKMSALALYAARHTKSGDNVDIILKHGWVKGDIETYGIGADNGDYDTNSTSLSVEYNKRLAQKNNTFIEPQLQLTLAHINGNEFTTRRNIKVSSDGIDSAIGRLGLAVGRQYRQGQIYFKASALHEFGGRGNVQMTSLGESYSESINYGGTWCELALGGNVRLAENNNLYFDVTRSFGGDFQKQWQVNAGLQWSF